ncbi:MAG TPA: Stp1/IreP family PP2C-type Ser/Thr phosphatase [Nitrospirota bacterium]|nr:Stp1/IreP family PP2C-type Ser/Thr phosphatase [Nitrospirota bacterium]
MKIISAGDTHPGKRRENNEDAYLLDDGMFLYAVADGVGGSEGGEVASRITIETLSGEMKDLLAGVDRTPPVGSSSDTATEFALLRSVVALANRNVRNGREQSAALSDMATTITLLVFRQRTAYLAHVGDSRAYLLRADEFRQITNDHTLVAEQLRAGFLTPDLARMSPYRHIITRAVGIDEEVRTDVLQMEIRKGDRFLLCTDGLTEMVADGDIRAILAGSEPAAAVQNLITAANDAGGMDNITVVVARIAEI